MSYYDFIEGVEIDFTKPLPEDTAKLFKQLINGNIGNNTNCIFHYKVNDWNYFLDFDGNSKKLKVTKYEYREQEKLRDMIREYKTRYKDYVDLDFEEGCFYNLGNQLMFYETEEECQIRIVPFGIRFEEKVFLHTAEEAYYIVYNKKTRDIKVTHDYPYDIESAQVEFEHLKFEENESKEDYNDIERMEFGFDYDLNVNSIISLYDICKRFEPNLYCDSTSEIFEAIFQIKKQIQYPIFSNEEAINHIHELKEMSPERLEELGYHPECYSIKDCFGIDSVHEHIYIQDLETLREWDTITNDESVKFLLQHYKEVHEIEFKLSDMKHLLDLLTLVKKEPNDVIRYILRGVVAEKMDLSKVLKNTKSLYQSGFIHSWKGRYNQDLIKKSNMRNCTKLSMKVLDDIEKKPTLDNLYRQLFSA